MLAAEGCGTTAATRLYDRVLVDAECTHDGSLRHLLKLARKGQKESKQRQPQSHQQLLSSPSNNASTASDGNSAGAGTDFVALDDTMLAPARVREIEELQLALLHAGFALLRRGGVLVYATCSLSRRQNEDNVAALLRAEPAAVLVRILGGGEEAVAPETGPERTGDRCGLAAFVPGLAPPPCEAGERAEDGTPLPHTLRFAPHLGTSGLFIAKLTKQ